MSGVRAGFWMRGLMGRDPVGDGPQVGQLALLEHDSVIRLTFSKKQEKKKVRKSEGGTGQWMGCREQNGR